MQTIPLYRYTRPDGGVTVSPVKPDGDYIERFRLVADEGMILSHPDHENTACIDVNDTEGWAEIPDTGADPEEATEEDYISALQTLGVDV